MLFWKILLAHVLTDFVFPQRPGTAAGETFKSRLRYGLIFFLTAFSILLPQFSFPLILALGLLTLFRMLIHDLNHWIQEHLGKEHWLIFLGVQFLQILALAALAYAFDPKYFFPLRRAFFTHWSDPTTMMFTSFFLLIVFGGGFFTGIFCRGFLDLFESKKRPGLERAGRYIGILERSLILMAVLFGRIEFIGYIFAAKSIARYPEMKEGDHFAEYYLIGTLTSISIAFFGGLWLKYLLGW